MYFITTKRMLEVCFFQHTPTFIIEPQKNVMETGKPCIHDIFAYNQSFDIQIVPVL